MDELSPELVDDEYEGLVIAAVKLKKYLLSKLVETLNFTSYSPGTSYSHLKEESLIVLLGLPSPQSYMSEVMLE